MSKLIVLFSSHFNHLHRISDWKLPLVGLKALGLSRLPQDWTPPFAVIGSSEITEVSPEREGGIQPFRPNYLSDILTPLFSRTASRLIVRSSASVEHIECRGWLESKQCDPTSDDVSRVSAEIVSHGMRVLRNASGNPSPMALVWCNSRSFTMSDLF